MFIKIFDKYIGDNAEWKVRFSDGTWEKILRAYRRLKELNKSVYSEYDSTPPANPSSSTLNTFEFGELARGSTKVGGYEHYSFNNAVLTILDGAIDLLMDEVVQNLEFSFNLYRETEVISLYRFS